MSKDKFLKELKDFLEGKDEVDIKEITEYFKSLEDKEWYNYMEELKKKRLSIHPSQKDYNEFWYGK